MKNWNDLLLETPSPAHAEAVFNHVEKELKAYQISTPLGRRWFWQALALSVVGVVSYGFWKKKSHPESVEMLALVESEDPEGDMELLADLDWVEDLEDLEDLDLLLDAKEEDFNG